MFPLIYIFGDWGLAVLRIVLALILIVHGWPKIKNYKKTAEWFGSAGFRPGSFWAAVAAIAEFFGGLALLLGFYTQVAAILIVGEFLVINVWKIAKRQPFIGGWELDLFILAAAFFLLTFGGGAVSLDRFLFWGWL